MAILKNVELLSCLLVKNHPDENKTCPNIAFYFVDFFVQTRYWSANGSENTKMAGLLWINNERF